jgi:acetyl-CoA carboxylase biotin carboxyl carrier protein
MDLNYVKKLIKILSTSAIDEIEIEEDGKRIRVSRNSHNSTPAPLVSGRATVPTITEGGVPVISPLLTAQPAPAVAPAAPEAKPEKKYHEVKSPIVGTFYRAPAPDADPYVEVGQEVQLGTVLCIIEAMKLMNEIESDAAGRIVKIHVENGHPVEYNQVLFSIEPV